MLPANSSVESLFDVLNYGKHSSGMAFDKEYRGFLKPVAKYVGKHRLSAAIGVYPRVEVRGTKIYRFRRTVGGC